MVRLYEASRIMWLPGLVTLQGRPACNIQEWLASANFAPAVSGTNIQLSGLDMPLLLRAFAGDTNRVASAGSESLRNIVNIASIPKSLGWSYVKMYYAAFFYAHALLRIWGRSPSYLRTSDLLRMRQTFNACGLTPPIKLQTAQYLLQADAGASQLVVALDKGGGGTHEAIWREFGNALEELRVQIRATAYTSADKHRLDTVLTTAANVLSNGGANAAWLSHMRNDIQYRQTEGVWYPYKGKQRSADLADKALTLLSGERTAEELAVLSGDALCRFGAGCSFTIALGREVLSDLANASGPHSFLRFGQAQFERSLLKSV